MIAYLLGELADEERARLEDAYIGDPALFEELTALETELIDDYVRGRLSPHERVLFEVRFLSTPARRERVAFARALADTRGHAAVEPGRNASAWRRWRWRPTRTWRPNLALATALAAVTLAVAASIAWWSFTPGPARETTAPSAASAPGAPKTPGTLSAAVSGDRPLAASPVALVLVPGSLRDPDAGAVLVLPAGAEGARIQMVYDGQGYPAYRAAIRTPEGREVWSQEDLAPTEPGARSVVIAVPARALPPGDYILTLSAGAGGARREDIADYSFRVARR